MKALYLAFTMTYELPCCKLSLQSQPPDNNPPIVAYDIWGICIVRWVEGLKIRGGDWYVLLLFHDGPRLM